MRVKDLQTVTVRKKNVAEISAQAFPLESPSNRLNHWFLKLLHLISFSEGLWIVYMLGKSWTFFHSTVRYISRKGSRREGICPSEGDLKVNYYSCLLGVCITLDSSKSKKEGK